MKVNMRKKPAFTLFITNGLCTSLVAVGVLLCAGSAWGEPVDAILATVDTEVILRSDILAEIAPALSDLRNKAGSQEEFDRQVEAQLRAALDQAIEGRILLREALLAGLEVRDDQVEARLDEVRKRYPSNEAFLKELEEAGETVSDFRNHVRKQILAISYGLQKRRGFEQEAVVSEADVLQYYEDHKDQFSHPERVRVSRIFLSAGTDPQERAKVKARLEELREELAGGADFAALAKAYSEGPEAASGGLVGWTAHGDLVEPLETAVFSLAPGEVSDALETEFGFQLLKVEGKEAAGIASLDEVRTQIEPELRAQYATGRYAKWMAELRKSSRVRVFL